MNLHATTTEGRWAWPLYALAVALPWSVAASGVLTGVVLLAALFAVLRGHRAAVPPLIWVPLLALVVASLAGTLLADPYPRRFDKLVDEMWIKSLLFAVPVLVVAAGRPAARRAMVMLLASGSVVALYGVYQHFTGDDPLRGREATHTMPEWHWMATGLYGHHLTYGGHILLLWCLALAWVLSRLESGRARGPWPWVVLLCCSMALLWSYARSAHLGALAGLGVLILSSGPRARIAAGAAGVAGLVGALSIEGIRMRFAALADPSNEETRLNLWKTSWAAFKDRPWRGWGPGNFEHVLAKHEVPGFYDSRAHAHSDPIMFALNAGVFATLSWLAFAAGIAWTLWRALAERADGRWIVLGALAGHVALTVAGAVQFYQSDDEVEFTQYLVVGLALGWGLVGSRQRASTGSGPR